MQLKPDSLYYFQVQDQMNIRQKKFCYFVVHYTNWTEIQKIVYDDTFCSQKMVKNLEHEKYLLLFLNTTISIK
jgi:hypothetical protein